MATPKSYKGQSLLYIALETGYDLDTVDTMKILFKDPDGVLGEFTTGITKIEGTEFPGIKSIMRYDFQEGDLVCDSDDGIWEFRTYIVVDGRDAEGATHKEYVGPTFLP